MRPGRGQPRPLVRYGTSDVHVYRQLHDRDEYSVSLARPPSLIVDCGAHIGLISRFFATAFPEATVVAVEPNLENFKLLEKNTGHLPNVRPVNAALVGAGGRVKIENPEADTWMFRTAPADDHEDGIPGLTVADLLERAGGDRIDILKLDVEGSEREVFSIGTEAWIDAVDVLLIETHDRFLPGCSRSLYGAVGDFPFEWRSGAVSGFARVRPESVAGGGPISEFRNGAFS